MGKIPSTLVRHVREVKDAHCKALTGSFQGHGKGGGVEFKGG